jgi:SPP1 gp7 family putative phage head morphogenesis protein
MSNLFKTIWSKAEKWLFVSEEESKPLNHSLGAPPNSQNKKGLRHKLSRLNNYRIDLEMKWWKSAVAWAEDAIRPRRNTLYRIYHRTMEDEHLLAQVRTAIFAVRSSEFRIEKDGKENEELKEFFLTPWFRKFLMYAVEAELWGHSLVEFDPTSKVDGQFTHIELIPRIHVRPEYGEVVLMEHDEKGVKYREGAISKHLVEIGDPYDLGLLKVASRAIIRKDYALGDWSRRNEKYGTPFLIVRTASQNKQELDEKQRMAENFGANSWAILDDQDQVNLLESNQAFTFQAFEKYADRVDKGISILINGQTGTTEEKAHVGSAEVHERILNTYTKDRLQRISDLINTKLFPFLISHGYPLIGARYVLPDLEDKKVNKGKVDNMDKGNEQKKEKEELSFEGKLQALTAVYSGSKGEQLTFNPINLDSIIQKAIRNVYDRKLKEGQVNAATWKMNVQSLWQAAQKGGGQSLVDVAYTDDRYEMLTQMRSNIHVFAAFKNHSEVIDLVAAMRDEKGKLRSFSDFKKVATSIAKNYNLNWLRTEYELALSSAQMAVKWQDFEANKDVLPSIRYQTQGDDRVRQGHRVLDGTILPVDDPFWDNFFPPNGYGCRCTAQQVANTNKVRPSRLPTDIEVPLIFRNNVGKTNQIYNQSHPFFTMVKKDQRNNLMKVTSRLAYEDAPGTKLLFDDKSAGFVVRQGTANKELEEIAKILALIGEQIYLLKKVKDKPSPNLLLSDLLYHAIKVGEKLEEQIRLAASNANRIVVQVDDKENLSSFLNGLKDILRKFDNITDLKVIHKGKVKSYTKSFWN